MITIGSYRLLFICLSGLMLSVESRFSEDDIATFLHYIFKLHNGVRYKHNVPLLERSAQMDAVAYERMDFVDKNKLDFEGLYGINDSWMYYDDTTQLNGAEAIKLFSMWYEQGNLYNYTREPNDRTEVNGFTQIVWERTTHIGLTFMYNENQYRVLVAYGPRGNLTSRYTSNVNSPRSDRKVRDPENNRLFYQTEVEKFLDRILQLHTEARTKHGVNPLIRDERLDDKSNIMLEKMYFSGNVPQSMFYGMNHAVRMYNCRNRLDDAEANEIFEEWYNTGKNYNYLVDPSDNAADAFTQIVWRDTTRIGISILGEECVYKVVVIYKCKGNIPGEYGSNVLTPQNMDQGESSGNN